MFEFNDTDIDEKRRKKIINELLLKEKFNFDSDFLLNIAIIAVIVILAVITHHFWWIYG